MGDPFSVSGTAVGITFLGIQVFQTLVRYYSQYKGFHEDIDNVLRQAEGLRQVLESIKETEERVERDGYAPSSQLHISLKLCEDVLNKLKRITEKCSTTASADSFQTRLREISNRILWPFKKETVRDIQAALSTFQDNLALALQSAGLDTVRRKFDDFQPALHTLQHQTSSIEKTSVQQTNAIGALHRDVTQAHVFQSEVVAREVSEMRSEL